MKKPYIVCHMKMSIDGRIDCAMTEKIQGVTEYYETLEALEAPSTLSGRNTAELEMAEEGFFKSVSDLPYGKIGFSKNMDAKCYEIITDTHGKLLWADDRHDEKPMLIITSEQVSQEYLDYLDHKKISWISQEYLDYLDHKKISWIACGEESIDLTKAMEIQYNEFGVKRLAIVGGVTINGAFLVAGLLDEVSLLVGPAIDGRAGMTAVFDGISADHEPFDLRFKSVKTYEDGAL